MHTRWIHNAIRDLKTHWWISSVPLTWHRWEPITGRPIRVGTLTKSNVPKIIILNANRGDATVIGSWNNSIPQDTLPTTSHWCLSDVIHSKEPRKASKNPEELLRQSWSSTKQPRQENCRPLVTAADQRNHKDSVPLHPIISTIGSYPDNVFEYLARLLVR